MAFTQTQLAPVLDNLTKMYLDYIKDAMTRVSDEEGTVSTRVSPHEISEGGHIGWIGWRYPDSEAPLFRDEIRGRATLYIDFEAVDFQTTVRKTGIDTPRGNVVCCDGQGPVPIVRNTDDENSPYLSRDSVFLLWLERLTSTGGQLEGFQYDASASIHTYSVNFNW